MRGEGRGMAEGGPRKEPDSWYRNIAPCRLLQRDGGGKCQTSTACEEKYFDFTRPAISLMLAPLACIYSHVTQANKHSVGGSSISAICWCRLRPGLSSSNNALQSVPAVLHDHVCPWTSGTLCVYIYVYLHKMGDSLE